MALTISVTVVAADRVIVVPSETLVAKDLRVVRTDRGKSRTNLRGRTFSMTMIADPVAATFIADKLAAIPVAQGRRQ